MTTPGHPRLQGAHAELRDVSKSFGGARALEGVNLQIGRGSIHALVGENGAGKSTVGKIISGVIAPDRGQLLLGGEPVRFRSPRDAISRGIVLIAQEMSIVPSLSVAENVFLGTEPRQAGFLLRRALSRRYSELAGTAGFELSGEANAGGLRTADQQKVEILRALCRNAELIVMDEPTAALSGPDVAALHEVIRRLARSGTTVVLVSHLLGEVLELADEVTVLRDGRIVRTTAAAGQTEESLLDAMLGRSVSATFPARQRVGPDAPVVLSVRGLTAPGVSGVSFDLHAGEIVGLAGLVGAGRTELARAVYQAHRTTAGTVSLAGGERLTQRHRADGPRAALRAGVAMIPESRKEHGLLPRRSVRENVSLASLGQLNRAGLVSGRPERRAVEQMLRPGGRPRPQPGDAGRRAVRGQSAETAVRQDAAVPAAGPHRGRADTWRGRRREAGHLRTAGHADCGRRRDTADLLGGGGDHRPGPPGAGDARRPDHGRTQRRPGDGGSNSFSRIRRHRKR